VNSVLLNARSQGLVFGKLDNEPLNEYEDKIELGSPLAIHYSQIRDHKKSTEFTKR
jgi:hypothetical protein